MPWESCEYPYFSYNTQRVPARVEGSYHSFHCDLFPVPNLRRGADLAVGASSNELLEVELRRAAAGLPVAALAVARLRPAEASSQRASPLMPRVLVVARAGSVRGTVPWRLRAGRRGSRQLAAGRSVANKGPLWE